MTIAQLNTTLKDYLFEELGEPSDILLDFSFHLPNKKWVQGNASSQNWVNLYLLEIKENVELRENEWQRTYNNGQVLEQKQPLYVDLYYLVTFYNKEKNSAHEHHYLELVLLALSDFSNLAKEPLISEEVLEQISIELFPKPYSDEHLGFQLWAALDQDARPFIPLKITIPLHSKVNRSSVPIKSKEFIYVQDEVLYSVEGIVLLKIDGMPIGDALVEIKKGGKIINKTRSDSRGKFKFLNLLNEVLTLSISAESYKQEDVLLNDLEEVSKKSMTIIMEKV